MSHALAAAGAALVLGVVMTAGDFVWHQFGVRHTAAAGVVHGAVMCLCIGGILGARAGRLAMGLLAGPVVGVIAAGTFYALASTFGWSAMLPAWMLFWICFALLQHVFGTETLPKALGRGVVAAGLSGLAFYAISGIWTNPAPGGPNYAVHLLSWSFAFLPGFLALLLSSRRATASV